MGWTSFRLNEPIKVWFVRQWEGNGKYKVLDCALVRRMTLYGAIKNNETGDVFCAVYLIRWTRDYDNFCYKDLSEHSGPYEDNCPERIFKLLTPLNNGNDPLGYARAWRERVEKYYITSKLLKGDFLLKTKIPIHFTDGSDYEYFKKVGKNIFAGEMINNDFKIRVRVSLSLRHYDFDIL